MTEPGLDQADRTIHRLQWELDMKEERIVVLVKIVSLLCKALQFGAEQWYDMSALERVNQIAELAIGGKPPLTPKE